MCCRVLSGSAVRPFTLLRFTVEPVDILAVRGLPALLNCSVVSEYPVRVEWKKDGTFLNLAADERRRILPSGSLFISTVEHSVHNKPDEGIYQCVASIDNLGTIISRSARVTVPGRGTAFLSFSSSFLPLFLPVLPSIISLIPSFIHSLSFLRSFLPLLTSLEPICNINNHSIIYNPH